MQHSCLSVEVPASATVGDLAAAVRATLPAEVAAKPQTLMFTGVKLSCPTESLSALGIKSGHSVQCLPVASGTTTPIGRNLGATVEPAAAAASSSPAASTSTSTDASSSSTASSTAAAGGSMIKIRFLNGRHMEIPYDEKMTGTGLKRLLESRGEGQASCLKMFSSGREVFDGLGLWQSKVFAGSSIDIQRRDPLFSSASTTASSSTSILKNPTALSAVGKREGRFVGLRNQGATCYLNSLVQALYMTPPFRSAIQSLGSFTLLPPLTKSLVDLFASLGNAPSAVSTEAFTSALKWGPVSRQEDVHEFWTLLCERLETDLHQTPHAKMIEDLFEGEQRDYTRCCECETTSYRSDKFRDLKLTVPTTDERRTHPSGHADALWALRQLLTPEPMVGAEQYECEVCGKKTDAERGVQLVRLPTILTLQLKRFGYDMKTYQRHKVNTPFAFDTAYDLRHFLTRPGVEESGAHPNGSINPLSEPPPLSGGETTEEDSPPGVQKTGFSPEPSSLPTRFDSPPREGTNPRFCDFNSPAIPTPQTPPHSRFCSLTTDSGACMTGGGGGGGGWPTSAPPTALAALVAVAMVARSTLMAMLR